MYIQKTDKTKIPKNNNIIHKKQACKKKKKMTGNFISNALTFQYE